MTKLKEPIYEFDVNIQYTLKIYMSIVQAKLLIKKKTISKP